MYSNVGMKTRINSYITGGLNKYDKLTHLFHLILSALLLFFKLFIFNLSRPGGVHFH